MLAGGHPQAREERSVGEMVGQPVLAAVGDLLPMLRDRAQETEDARDVPGETIKALEDAGFFRLLQPSRYGGLEADPLIFYRAVRMIASSCGSSSWASSRWQPRRKSGAPIPTPGCRPHTLRPAERNSPTAGTG